ncbi:hypothetical protein HF086_007010 [Spodoptera exigua]|uniref:Malate dehydrogenase n=1 Tax=Spodoptera exigua TaxID=7107 RepID=A0A922MYZ0_SPOEX|nr:hypothetical protein HF086_007010 [Spodoptera exigua]
MFSRVLRPVATVAFQNGAKNFSTSPEMQFKVMVAGASGGIGQPLSLLLKMNPLVSNLALYDIAPVTPGVAADLSHMDFPAKVLGYKGPEELPNAIAGSHVVVIPAGVPRKPGMTRDDLFNVNASIVRDLAQCIAVHAPKAIICIITNPVNSMVPIASEVMKKNGVYDPNRILGVTTLDVVRSCTFIGAINGIDPRSVSIPVIGGHSGVTIIPLLSQCKPAVVKAKAGGGSATLSMAWSGAKFTNSVLRGLKGDENVVECAYMKSDLTEASYFANPVQFGKNGVAKNLGYGKLNAYEEKLLNAALPELKKNIAKGVEFVSK